MLRASIISGFIAMFVAITLIVGLASLLAPGIVVAGNAYLGVGVADAVRSADEAAERVRAHLAGEPVRSENVR